MQEREFKPSIIDFTVKHLLFISLLFLFTTASGSALAQNPSQDDDWQFGLGIYGWGAFIGGETATGGDVSIDLDDILDNLNFTAMVVAGVRKGKWSFATDLIYLDLEGDKDSVVPTAAGSIGVNTNVELKSWVVTPTVAYAVLESDTASLNIRGGARYLSLDTDIAMNSNISSMPVYASVSDSGSVWDAIIGVNGEIAFGKGWYAPYYLDIGTGESDFTWQVAAGVGYKFDICNVTLDYRYLSWDFDDKSSLDSMNINGPMLGVLFKF